MVVLGILHCIVWPHGAFICTLFGCCIIIFLFFGLFFSLFLSCVVFFAIVCSFTVAPTLFSKSDSSASSTSDALELDVAVVAVFALIIISSSFKYGIFSLINWFVWIFHWQFYKLHTNRLENKCNLTFSFFWLWTQNFQCEFCLVC